jgi:hypothetical protein
MSPHQTAFTVPDLAIELDRLKRDITDMELRETSYRILFEYLLEFMRKKGILLERRMKGAVEEIHPSATWNLVEAMEWQEKLEALVKGLERKPHGDLPETQDRNDG